MKQFEIVPHTGGKLMIVPSQNMIGFENQSDHAAASFQLCFSLVDGSVTYIPFGGLGTNNIPNGGIPIYVFSDNEGYFGRTCPVCNGYFRTDSGGEEYFCPYCSHFDRSLAFSTATQREYIQVYINTVLSALQDKCDTKIDLDGIIANLSNNRSPFVYSEERQQRNNKCKSCKTRYDILGEFGCCPNCGSLNTFEVFNDSLNRLLKRLNNSLIEVEPETHSYEWVDVLKNCVSEFEAMAKDISKQLVRLPATPSRKEEIRRINFQRISEANDNLSNWFGIDFLKGISNEDRLFISRCFHRRHILTHNAGVVDEKYIKNTEDTTVRLNQKIYVEKDEAIKLISLMRTIAKKLFDGYESIS
ncbi:hypothetical protein [Neobacillus niacini]|uniref:hypothetical protein n=1 Tax=Neobacillus niacini TaxID=86668 RepID=UPI0005ED6A1C|nr:hypothetical protein [Neobacillus niacini]